MQFTPASKTVVLGNGVDEDSVWFRDLPVPTHIQTQQLPTETVPVGASNEWDHFEGEFEATFYPPGDYLFVLNAAGYDQYSVVITATEA